MTLKQSFTLYQVLSTSAQSFSVFFRWDPVRDWNEKFFAADVTTWKCKSCAQMDVPCFAQCFDRKHDNISGNVERRRVEKHVRAWRKHIRRQSEANFLYCDNLPNKFNNNFFQFLPSVPLSRAGFAFHVLKNLFIARVSSNGKQTLRSFFIVVRPS